MTQSAAALRNFKWVVLGCRGLYVDVAESSYKTFESGKWMAEQIEVSVAAQGRVAIEQKFT